MACDLAEHGVRARIEARQVEVGTPTRRDHLGPRVRALDREVVVDAPAVHDVEPAGLRRRDHLRGDGEFGESDLRCGNAGARRRDCVVRLVDRSHPEPDRDGTGEQCDGCERPDQEGPEVASRLARLDERVDRVEIALGEVLRAIDGLARGFVGGEAHETILRCRPLLLSGSGVGQRRDFGPDLPRWPDLRGSRRGFRRARRPSAQPGPLRRGAGCSACRRESSRDRRRGHSRASRDASRSPSRRAR